MKHTVIVTLLLSFSIGLKAQPTPTPADARLKGYEQRNTLQSNTPWGVLSPENIGPSIFSCRVTDVDVNPADASKFYVAYASGGLWYTESNGTTFRPVFDREAAMTIGDIAVDWQRSIVWVGTGENNSSRSSYAGTGLYRSTDSGKTWEWKGLPESHHIGRVVLHPYNPDIVWVAVLGHLYSPSTERGVFKTTDGGKTWQRTLFVDDNSGAIDLILDPGDPNTLYAATWQRERRAWNFIGAGNGSGIWKSTDGGETWKNVSAATTGFPVGPNAGRIGLAASRKNGQTILYASIDNQNLKPKKIQPASDALTKDHFRIMDKTAFSALSDDKLGEYLKNNGFPEHYNATSVKGMVAEGKIAPTALVEYLEDANSSLTETDYIGAEVYRSNDGGKTWAKTHQEPLDGINFTYGYYFSNVRTDPNNPEQVYLLGFYAIRSDDGGKTWKKINPANVHADHHALWVNPNKSGHLINGNDGGLNISWDNGESWMLCNTPPVGQFYAIGVDDAKPYNVYGGAQDNGVWVGPSDYKASHEWHASGQYPYKELLGGDGMQVQVDTRDNNIVYTGFQFGNYFRIDKRTGERKPIAPKHNLGERPLRFNWQSPIHLSRHNQDVLYFGANKVFRSLDKGDHWEPLSGDLTAGGLKGNVPYGTLSTLAESPMKFGLLYAGSDDGLIHVSRDGGENWIKISDALPQKLWVSRVEPSAHERGRVYASLNGYRWDDFAAYLYTSQDYGQTWQRLGLELPAEPINVVREDPENQDLLYVGTDHNLYVSLDRGKTFHPFNPDFPNTPVHDLVVQRRAKDLLIGTHGRSMYKVNVAPLQALTSEVMAKTVHLFDLAKRRFSPQWGKKRPWDTAKDPEMPILFHATSPGNIQWSVKTKDGLVLQTGEATGSKGLNKMIYNLDIREDALKKYKESLAKEAKKEVEFEKSDTGKYYLRKGTYRFTLEKDGKTETKDLSVE